MLESVVAEGTAVEAPPHAVAPAKTMQRMPDGSLPNPLIAEVAFIPCNRGGVGAPGVDRRGAVIPHPLHARLLQQPADATFPSGPGHRDDHRLGGALFAIMPVPAAEAEHLIAVHRHEAVGVQPDLGDPVANGEERVLGIVRIGERFVAQQMEVIPSEACEQAVEVALQRAAYVDHDSGWRATIRRSRAPR